METRRARTRVVVSMLVLAGLLGFCLYAIAGDLEPNAPPGPTMHTLDEIYDAVNTASSGIAEREGYIKWYNYPAGDNTVFTVPPAKQFVLLKLLGYGVNPNWSLSVNDEVIFSRSGLPFGSPDNLHHMWDFPDRCVVLSAGDELKVGNSTGENLAIHIVGYFFNVP